MKKLLKVFALAMAVACAAPAMKAERLPMGVDKMPSQVQLFLNEYYPGVGVKAAWAKMMRPTSEPMYYRVNLDNGTNIKFSLDGNWDKISAKNSDSSISIDLLPQAARDYISTNYPKANIKSINFKKDYYKVSLSNGEKLRFAKTYGLESKSK